jgi:hypothetical protein
MFWEKEILSRQHQAQNRRFFSKMATFRYKSATSLWVNRQIDTNRLAYCYEADSHTPDNLRVRKPRYGKLTTFALTTLIP